MEMQQDLHTLADQRSEVRLQGRQVEGIQALLVDLSPNEGWDQDRRWEGAVCNLSSGGLELRVAKDFPHPVDSKVFVTLKFPRQNDWLQMESRIRHCHFDAEHMILGIQFLWQHRPGPQRETEFEFCRQLMLCEGRKS